MAICLNWSRLIPSSSTIFSVTWVFLVMMVPSGQRRVASAPFRVFFPLRLENRSYSGWRRTVYSRPWWRKVSSTKVSWLSDSAYMLRKDRSRRSLPLSLP